TGYDVGEIVRAFIIIRDGFALPGLYREIDALDNRIGGQVQLDLYVAVERMLVEGCARYLKNGNSGRALGASITQLHDARKVLEPKLASLMSDFPRQRLAERKSALLNDGVPQALAERISLLD